MYMQAYGGRVYLTGHFYTGDTASWNQFGLDSVVVSGNTASGSYGMDCSCNGGTFTMTKGGAAPTVNLMDYTPGGLNYSWTYRSAPADSVQMTFSKLIVRIDTVQGRPCHAMRQIMQRSTGSSIWCTWFAQEASGVLLCAFSGSGDNIDSAAVYPTPKMWMPAAQAGVGYKWDFDAPDMGGHFWFTVTDVAASANVPAGNFTDCLKLHLVLTDSLGDTTQINDYWHDKTSGEVLNRGWNSYFGQMSLELDTFVIR